MCVPTGQEVRRRRSHVASRHLPHTLPASDPYLVCAIQRQINQDEDHGDAVVDTIPIAGDLEDWGGKPMDYEVQRLSKSDSHADKEKEGIRLILKGGIRKRIDQKAIIEFLCEWKRTGLEDEYKPEHPYERAVGRQEGETGGDGEQTDPEPAGETQLLKSDNAALRFVSYGAEKGDDKFEILRLTWYTEHACEGAFEESGHWGFFTWFVVM